MTEPFFTSLLEKSEYKTKKRPPVFSRQVDFWEDWDPAKRAEVEKAGYDPAQPRDEEGKWTETGKYLVPPTRKLTGNYDVRKDVLERRRGALINSYGEEEVKKVEDNVKGILAKSKIGMYRSLRSLEDIVESGRIKSQHETGTSSGIYDRDLRKQTEMRLFGTNPSFDKKVIYGFAYDPGLSSTNPPTLGYGDAEVLITFKDSIKERATFTKDDSLNGLAQPSSLKDPQIPSLVGMKMVTEGKFWAPRIQQHIDRMNKGTTPTTVEELRSIYQSSYIETQIHRGVSAKEIESIQFRNPAVMGRHPLFLKMIRNWAKKNNVQITLRSGSLEEVP